MCFGSQDSILVHLWLPIGHFSTHFGFQVGTLACIFFSNRAQGGVIYIYFFPFLQGSMFLPTGEPGCLSEARFEATEDVAASVRVNQKGD